MQFDLLQNRIVMFKKFLNIFVVAEPVKYASPTAGLHCRKPVLQAYFACIGPAGIALYFSLFNIEKPP